MRKVLLLCLLGYSLIVSAEKPALDSFAEAYEIKTDGSSAIYRLELPAEIYETVFRADLGDVRVYNQKEERVPFAIQRQRDKKLLRTAWFDLPLFAIKGDMERDDQERSLDIVMGPDGSILSLKYKRDQEAPQGEGIRRYLIDLSGIDKSVDALEVIIDHSETDSYLKKVMLEASDDLNQWTMLVDDATLTELSYGTHSLRKNQIKLPDRSYKYLRFTWLDDPEDFRVTNIRALLKTQHREERYRWSSVQGSRSEKQANVYHFDTGGYFPVERINVTLPDENTLIDAVVRSRVDADDKWETQYLFQSVITVIDTGCWK